MSVGDRRRGSAGLRNELDPNIMPRQMRALEEVATRLLDERPAPDPAFRAQLSGLAALVVAVILALQLGSG